MSDRLLRINERARQVVSETISQLSDPRIGFVTITTVRVARDFRSAKVYFSVLGDEDARDTTERALNSAHGIIQRAIAREAKMHHTPQLDFVYDDGTDMAMRLDEILKHGDPALPPRPNEENS
jgi:ribosome-binding factor A